MHRRHLIATLFAVGLSTLLPAAHAAAPLQLQVYNPGEKAIFPVSSVIVSGERDAILVDAQFQHHDALALVRQIKDSGKTLRTVYISHSDPDYYFGLDVIHAAFPSAKIVATPQTVAAIKANMNGKLAYWAPLMKDNAPRALVLPQVLHADHLSLEGKRIEIKGLKGASPERSYLWIPSLKTVAGGVVVSSGLHVWVADTQTPQSRANWLATLDEIAALRPQAIVPGHFLGAAPAGMAALDYTRNYLQAFEKAAAAAKDSAALIKAMQEKFPQARENASLELSAKVIKGEMTWPQ
ncbi:MBL fold metallo-hydrolase [Janthinobacterium psychrotolerans]|uniref:Glyoxylase, beta-lactamase superfamily II n=1 Tax=Janthinobacterium psychrotolerans TaxID=1747903 RepID=A0A1A7BXJ6_9BURK|nr:MBL fold metallo-hydrolase [Janthinobacterium psychrotolerans]OBV36843.1 Glyoxylase, beta-lactamase superfamily II [Janthinobacterium psychrotolerans]